MKEITEPNKKLKLKENVPQLEEGSKDPLDFRNHKASDTNPATEGNLGKRKELGKNGYLLGESFSLLYIYHTAVYLSVCCMEPVMVIMHHGNWMV